jgi:regulator of PEP synthase PpsR (kinase-PPPase family)
MASQEMRVALETACQERSIPSVDLLGVLLERLEEFLGVAPTGKPGLLHQVDDGYFERLDALAFTVRHDDNASSGDLAEADIILVGVSRTSKTPLSIYLAQEGWKVANVPVVIGEDLPAEHFRADQSRVVGLTTTAERLAEVRKARLTRVGGTDSTYADVDRIRQELRYCQELFDRNPSWVTIDVTGKSVEESAGEVLDRLFGKERPL